MTEQNDWYAVCMNHGTVLGIAPDKGMMEGTAREHKERLGCKIVIVGQKV